MQVFQLPKQGRIFNYALLILLLLLAIVLGCAPLITAASDMATIFCLGISAISIVFILSALNETSAKIILDADGVTKVAFGGKQRILYTDMLGFRSGNEYLYIYSNRDSGEIIYIPERLAQTGKIEMLLRQHCSWVFDEIRMMEDQYLHLYSNAKARLWAYILTGLSMLLAVLVFIYGASFPWLLIALFLCLPATILFAARFRRTSLISGHARAEQIVFAIPVFVFIGLMMCNKDYFLLDSTPVRTWAMAIMFALVLLQLCTFREHRKQSINFFMMTSVNAILYFGCGYVMVEAANSLLDKSRPRTYEISITGKHIGKKTKYTGYYFKLAPWAHQLPFGEIAVPKSLYDRRQAADKVYVLYGEGALGMPWYQLLPQ